MKIRMKTLEAGPDGVFQVGAVRDLDEKAARARVDGGFAEYIGIPAREQAPEAAEEERDVEPEEETTDESEEQASEVAVVSPPEKAVMPRPKPRRK